MKNAICTPHLGYVEERVYEGIYGVAIDQIVAFAQGKPINVANPEALNTK
jgi:D-3-phosphoglycerate dehydrogenase